MRKQVETILQALLAASLAVSLMGCAATRPPQRIQDAIHTMNRHMPEYVTEANKALAGSEHPDKERLIGMGERLADAVDALDRWASGKEEVREEAER
ncbi:conserved exported hypothetical protein [Desulfosarcina cetonica]|jgi:hypothetical protein|uniref:hypothetical protein n=1 Tax=Desulfosarcina cetonica TaxID=90730 RepID=UPI0006D0640C|nr:hypothetical protein [Desulfosarcina cetonica]VTR66803.1 conserved exported hypothetical protein [Desulfosarcina cetonica]